MNSLNQMAVCLRRPFSSIGSPEAACKRLI
jgi:hypothetical protein